MATETMAIAPPPVHSAVLPSMRSSTQDTQKFYTIDGIVRTQAAEAPEHPLLGYPVKGVSDFALYTARALDELVDQAVAAYQRRGLKPVVGIQQSRGPSPVKILTSICVQDPNLSSPPVIAILAPSSLELIFTFLALSRLGYTTLFLSTRLTPAALSRLLGTAGSEALITPPSLAPTVTEIQKATICEHIPLLEAGEAEMGTSPRFHRNYDPVLQAKKIAWIIHSSGSTGFPKPIYLSHEACIANFSAGVTGRAFCTSPLFHSHGLMEVGRAFVAKGTMYLGNYRLPVTRKNLMDAMAVAQPEVLCAVPYVIKLLAESEAGIAQLVRTKYVSYAGSACPDEVGDLLTARGAKLVSNFGA